MAKIAESRPARRWNKPRIRCVHINNTIVICIDTVGSGEEPASLVFTGAARNGAIGKKGAYDEIQGGTSYDADDATFGTNGSC